LKVCPWTQFLNNLKWEIFRGTFQGIANVFS
jgi:hypothetical protein